MLLVIVTHDSSMYGDHHIGKTRRPCVPYAKRDFMFNSDHMMGVEGNYTTPEALGLILFYSPEFSSDIVTIANNYYKKTLSDTFTSTLSFFNTFLLAVAFIYPATMPLTKNYRRFNYGPFQAVGCCRERDAEGGREGGGEMDRGQI